MVIDYETSQWKDNAIIDVQPSGSGVTVCPQNYEKLSGTFWGLEAICKRGGDYSLGGCPRKSGGVTQAGMDTETVSDFYYQNICFRRSPMENYHSMSNKRSTKAGCSTNFCGSRDKQDKGICLDLAATCPINHLEHSNSTTPS